VQTITENRSTLKKPIFCLDNPDHFKMIFKTTKVRNRLLLELMARGGMRIGEVLKIRPIDVENRKIILHNPKSGREAY
jgi:integrase